VHRIQNLEGNFFLCLSRWIGRPWRVGMPSSPATVCESDGTVTNRGNSVGMAPCRPALVTDEGWTG